MARPADEVVAQGEQLTAALAEEVLGRADDDELDAGILERRTPGDPRSSSPDTAGSGARRSSRRR